MANIQLGRRAATPDQHAVTTRSSTDSSVTCSYRRLAQACLHLADDVVQGIARKSTSQLILCARFGLCPVPECPWLVAVHRGGSDRFKIRKGRSEASARLSTTSRNSSVELAHVCSAEYTRRLTDFDGQAAARCSLAAPGKLVGDGHGSAKRPRAAHVALHTKMDGTRNTTSMAERRLLRLP